MKWRIIRVFLIFGFPFILGCGQQQIASNSCDSCHQSSLLAAAAERQAHLDIISSLTLRKVELETSLAAVLKERDEWKKKANDAKRQSQKILQPASRGGLQSQAGSNPGGWFSAVITGYCGCPRCCGKWSKGFEPSRLGTIAADKKYPFGTRIEIEGWGIFTVADRGGAVKGNIFDIYCRTHEEALNIGRRKVRARVL